MHDEPQYFSIEKISSSSSMPIRNEKRTQNVILLFLCAVLASFLLMCWPRRKPRNVTLDVFVWICVCASLIVCLCEWARALLLLLLLNNCCIAMRNGQCMYQCVWSSVSTLDKIIWKKKKKNEHTQQRQPHKIATSVHFALIYLPMTQLNIINPHPNIDLCTEQLKLKRS